MPLSNFKLKKCYRNDLHILRALSIQTFKETYEVFNTPEDMKIYIETDLSTEKLSKELQLPDTAFYLAYSGKTPVGFLKLNFISNSRIETTMRGLEIERIYVLKLYQGGGIGSFLMNKVNSLASSLQYDYIWLGVWENNINARNFYKRKGFEEFGNQVFVLGNDKQLDLLVWKKLG